METSVRNYLPAVLKENKSGWIIEYYVAHPITTKLVRKKIKLERLRNRYTSVKELRAHCAQMIRILNDKLAGGWNPFFLEEDARLYEKMTTVSELFLQEKKKELRYNSYRSYSSFITIFKDWCNKHHPDMFASMFSQLYAVRYMEYIYKERNVGVTTYNNQIKMARAFFNWMKERCYTQTNPFEKVKSKPKIQKTRIIIPEDIRTKISDYLIKNNPSYLLICRLIYTSLIRPNEIKLLKIGNINLKERYITVVDTVAKNHHQRTSAINAEIIELIKQLDIMSYPSSFYIFGKNLTPDKERAGNGRLGEEWVKMRNKLSLPKEMQMYSLRDTGIHEMIKSGINDLSVMQHADHSSLEMTTIYANHKDKALNELIYTNAPKF